MMNIYLFDFKILDQCTHYHHDYDYIIHYDYHHSNHNHKHRYDEMENFSNIVNQGKYASFTAVTHPTAPIFRSLFMFHPECAFPSCFTLNYAKQFVTHYAIYL